MNRLDASFLKGRPRPTSRIVQFGEGNFLRAFFDWKVDRLNEKLGADWGVVVVRPIAGGFPASLNEQDGVYTTVIRGVDDKGREVAEPRLIACVRKEIPAYGDWNGVLALARDPNIRMIVSNTTEAGISYDPASRFDDTPPASYPAKLTRFLWERWSTGGRDRAKGFQIMPCELIDHNADELRKCVLRHCADWKLDPGFGKWVETANDFYATLVDRIVPGYPKLEAESLEKQFGYEDKFMVAAELFHLLVVERKPGVPPLELPLDGNDDGVVIAPDAGPYKERKVAILNGSHTGLCPLSLLAGVETVGEAVRDPAAARFIDLLLEQEVKPFLSLPRDELEAFAASVLRRFSNPYIRHLWYDISLNGISKYKTRNLPRAQAYLAGKGQAPRLMSLSLAAWAAFYLGRFAGAAKFPPRDSADVLKVFEGLKAIQDVDAMIGAYLKEASFWGESIDDPKLHKEVVAAFRFLTEKPFSFARLKQYLDA